MQAADSAPFFPNGWATRRAVGWAPALPSPGYQLGYQVDPDRFDPFPGSPVFKDLDEAFAYARRTGWLRQQTCDALSG
jgi:hypothetical protein